MTPVAHTSGLPRHEAAMRECMRLALRGAGRVSPNPLVGAVLVRGGRIIARGWHRKFGGPHAEVECLDRAKGKARGGTLYVNLEPCAHYGKTPPCTDPIIASGIREVVVAMRDPNPLVAGRGIRMLRGAGLRVTSGILEAEARHLNRTFIKHITRGIPYVHMKVAQSIDGYIGARGAPRYITSSAALRLAHRWRAEHDAVLVGAGTVRADNPHLSVRHHRGRDPHVVIIDGALSVPDDANALRRESGRGVFLCTSEEAASQQRNKVEHLESRGVVVLRFPAPKGRISLRSVLEGLYRFSIGSILVEGGREIFTECLREGLVDELSFFVAPTVFGGGVPVFCPEAEAEVKQIRDVTFAARRVGRDMLYTALLEGGG